MLKDMKTKNIWLLALVSAMVILNGCKSEEPFDTQSPDDAPLILKPYNESGTGSFTYDLPNPDTPLLDSVTVTPSRYTTVNWYLDSALIYTGLKIEMCFPAGTYALTIEAVTDAGKKTQRTGSVTVHPYATDPFSAAAADGRHLVPGVEMTIVGQNLSKVIELVVTSDIFGTKEVCSFRPTDKTDATLTFVLPELADGTYYLRFKDALGTVYGSDAIQVHNAAVALSGFEEFVPGQEWVITGVGLKNVASVKVDATEITDLKVTDESVTLIAPEAEVGVHTLSMTNKDGSSVLFITSAGVVAEVEAIVSAETTIWEGPVALKWDAERVKVASNVMAQVPVGSTVYVYFEKLPDGDENYYEGSEYKQYYALRITTPWWDGYDLVAQMDMGDAVSPFSFTYTDDCKNKVETCGAMSLVGWGLNINKITFK